MSLTLEIIIFATAHLLSLLAACQALLTKRDPRAALGWTALLLFLPVAGLIIYLIFGISRAQSRAERIMRKIARINNHYNAQWREAPHETVISSEARTLSDIGHKLTSEELCGPNKIIPLHNGDAAYPQMLTAINNAKEHVFLSTYIFNYGIAARAFIIALERAHKRGVDVRVLVDGVGQYYSWKKPWRILKKGGVATALFRPLKLFPPNLGINLRSHRKVMVCDGVGFTGGMNIADGNLFYPEIFYKTILERDIPDRDLAIKIAKKIKRKRPPLIQDVHFRCEGPIVNQLRKAFLLNWSFCRDHIYDLPPIKDKETGDSLCRVIVDGPGSDLDLINDIICGAVNLSHEHVRIVTPYFLPTHDLMASFRSAAQRGVKVTVVLPKINNLKFVAWACARLLPELLNAGVRVWEQPPPFAHTKLLTVDNFYSLIGSANLDPRSLRLNFELDMEIFDPTFTTNLNAFIDSTIDNGGREILLWQLNELSFAKKLRNAACWVLSPYL